MMNKIFDFSYMTKILKKDIIHIRIPSDTVSNLFFSEENNTSPNNQYHENNIVYNRIAHFSFLILRKDIKCYNFFYCFFCVSFMFYFFHTI